MSIQNILGNVASTLSHQASASQGAASDAIQALVGRTSATFSILWDGGFVGMNAAVLETMTEAVNKLLQAVEGKLQEFNENETFVTGLAGEAREAAGEYVKAVKTLLLAYASTYRNFIALARESVETMKAGDTANAATIRDTAAEVNARAAEITAQIRE